MNKNIDYSLYVVTDRNIMSSDSIEQSVEFSIKGGATIIQLRENNIEDKEFYNLAVAVKLITDKYNIPLIINNRIDIALAVNAAGVHVGQQDIPADVVRKIIGENKLLGVSARNLKEAVNAVENGADYLGIGAMYKTAVKTDAVLVSIEELKNIRRNIEKPIVVIGGINEDTLPDFDEIGINGIAVVSAIVGAENVMLAANSIYKRFLKGQK
jgi:thiamine-phosphate pyrophosphorylase